MGSSSYLAWSPCTRYLDLQRIQKSGAYPTIKRTRAVDLGTLEVQVLLKPTFFPERLLPGEPGELLGKGLRSLPSALFPPPSKDLLSRILELKGPAIWQFSGSKVYASRKNMSRIRASRRTCFCLARVAMSYVFLWTWCV